MDNKMKLLGINSKVYTGIFIGVLLSMVLLLARNYFAEKVENVPDNEIPMYGEISIEDAPEKTSPRITFNNEEDKKYFAADAVKLGWRYFYQGDRKTAMKRFNQAWMIDPAYSEVYYGFAVLMSLHGRGNDAIKFYKKALELNPQHPMALANLARSYYNNAYTLYREKQSSKPDDKVQAILKEALELYEKAILNAATDSDVRLSSLENDLSYIYYQWAVALEFSGQYRLAWEKIKLCKEHKGGHLIEERFIKELSRYMPEPQ